MVSAGELHITTIVLWELAHHRLSLSDREVTHLEECERCIRTLGICEMAKSMAHAEQLLREEFGESVS